MRLTGTCGHLVAWLAAWSRDDDAAALVVDTASHTGMPREDPHGSCWFVLAGGNMEGGWAGRFLSPGCYAAVSAQTAGWPAQPSSSYGGVGQADSSIRSDPAGRRSLRRAYSSASSTTSHI